MLLSGLAAREARRLGHAAFGPLHLLLAVVRDGGVLGDALESAGVSEGRITSLLTDMGFEPPQWKGWVTSSSAWHEVDGFAQGWAASDGRMPGVEDGVVAFIWAAYWPFLDVDRAAVVRALQNSGVRTPSTSLPPIPPPHDYSGRVYFDAGYTQRVLEELPKLLPSPGILGWNIEGDRAWVVSASGVDLEAAVELVVSSADRTHG